MRRPIIASLTTAAVAVSLAVSAVIAPAALAGSAAQRPSGTRPPVAGFTLGDPGVLHVGSTWYNFFTGHLGKVATSTHINGPWTLQAAPALSKDPVWAQQTTAHAKPSYWAPSAVFAGPHYVLTFAAPRRDNPNLRCIGLGFSSTPQGPYKPAKTPLACVGGKYGAPDAMPGAHKNDSVIDATPRLLTDGGTTGLYVTYKTQHKVYTSSKKFHYYSTVRLVQVGISGTTAKQITLAHASQIITTRPTNIEENPVLVQRGGLFTLFTSLGGYTTCKYHTVYRTSKNVWNWPSASHTLPFPASANTCGTGDADVYPSTGRSGPIFWSGRRRTTGSKTAFFLYVGKLTWTHARPRVTKVYSRG